MLKIDVKQYIDGMFHDWWGVELMFICGSSIVRVFYHKLFDSTRNSTSRVFHAFYSVTDWQEGSCLGWQYHPTTCSISSFWSENHFPRCHYFYEFLFPFILSLTLSLDILIQRRWRREKNEMLKTDVKLYSKTNVLRLVRVGNSSIESCCCWYYYGVLYSFVCSTISCSLLPQNLLAAVFNFVHTTKVSLVMCLVVIWDQRTLGSSSFRSENLCTKYQFLFLNYCFHSFFHCPLYWIS